MILSPKQTTLAYRCPACGGVPTAPVGIFSLSGDMFRLKCDCGGSYLTLEKTKDGKIRLTVPCLVCSTNHSFVISQNVFFGSDIFVIPCNLSGVDICFIGKPECVEEAVKKSNDELIKMLGDASLDQLKGDESSLPEPEVLDILAYVVSELNDEGKVYCKCKDGGDYVCEISSDKITVRCKKCGASKDITAHGMIEAHDFLNADSLTLE